VQKAKKIDVLTSWLIVANSGSIAKMPAVSWQWHWSNCSLQVCNIPK